MWGISRRVDVLLGRDSVVRKIADAVDRPEIEIKRKTVRIVRGTKEVRVEVMVSEGLGFRVT
jgi:hypothetical protein